jgi:hypothetical protein
MTSELAVPNCRVQSAVVTHMRSIVFEPGAPSVKFAAQACQSVQLGALVTVL